MKKLWITAVLLGTFASPFYARAAQTTKTTTTVKVEKHKYPQGILFPYSLLDEATVGNIDENGRVNYFHLQDNKPLNEFIDAVAHADLTQFPTFPIKVKDPKTGRTEKTVIDHSAELVFWINAYNGLIFHTIAQHYPLKSISEIKNFDTAKTHTVAGKEYSFKQLRQKIASFDPRALFALTSGTEGGVLPPRTAYRYTGLNASLDAAVRIFVNNPNNVHINRIQNTVRINETFKLFNDAFKPHSSHRRWGGIRYILAAYTEHGSDQRYLTNTEYTLQFAPASHKLNDVTHK